MSILFDLITVGSVPISCAITYLSGKKYLSKKIKPDSNGHYSWLYVKGLGHLCPKCNNHSAGKGESRSDICECPEYYQLHFHFKCVNCAFKTIMKTVDDK